MLKSLVFQTSKRNRATHLRAHGVDLTLAGCQKNNKSYVRHIQFSQQVHWNSNKRKGNGLVHQIWVITNKYTNNHGSITGYGIEN